MKREQRMDFVGYIFTKLVSVAGWTMILDWHGKASAISTRQWKRWPKVNVLKKRVKGKR